MPQKQRYIKEEAVRMNRADSAIDCGCCNFCCRNRSIQEEVSMKNDLSESTA